MRECVEDVVGEDNVDTSYEGSSFKDQSMKYHIPCQLTNFAFDEQEAQRSAAIAQSLDSAACPIPDEHSEHDGVVDD